MLHLILALLWATFVASVYAIGAYLMGEPLSTRQYIVHCLVITFAAWTWSRFHKRRELQQTKNSNPE